MNPTKDECVDHIDFDEHNNRKINLRICSKQENSRHRRDSINNKTGYNGVFLMTYKDGRQRYRAFTKNNQKYINGGEFKTIEEAIEARKKLEEKYFGEFLSDSTIRANESTDEKVS